MVSPPFTLEQNPTWTNINPELWMLIMSNNRELSYPNLGWTGDGASISLSRAVPDPQALAIARQTQELLKPSEIILMGSRVTADHRQDSDVDFMSVPPDGAMVAKTDETLRQLLNQTVCLKSRQARCHVLYWETL